jgi:hypothetical protein
MGRVVMKTSYTHATSALAHRNPLSWCGSAMSGHNDARLRQFCIQLQPASVKQLNHLVAIHARHPRGWGMSQHALELRMLQDVLASRPGGKIHACLEKLSHGYRVSILPIETRLVRPLE